MNTVIKIEDLTKEYRLGMINHATLRQDLQTWWAKMRGQEDPNSLAAITDRNDRAFHAVKNGRILALDRVSFDVAKGEVVGIIGKNGAGKSTLLKIISRVTTPTHGTVKLKGRVGSLLEVGTGFHPELSGRENVFLNGAILGMRRAEIEKKFDEIVSFAEVEKFIDTPVKRYSSGMYVRLAFAVAAHLEPEILIVDEVLAVGDTAFQKKCMGKMGNVAKEGRTILFVSHNMQAIRQLCTRAILLTEGKIQWNGSTEDAIETYLKEIPKADSPDSLKRLIEALPSDEAFRLTAVAVTQDGRSMDVVASGKPVEVSIAFEVLKETPALRVFFDLHDLEGTLLIRSFHDENADEIPVMRPGRFIARAMIPANFLAPASYELRILATIYNIRMCIPYPGICIPISVAPTSNVNRAYMAAGEPIRGKFAPLLQWEIKKVETGHE